jgi:hypothetical protein
MRDFSIISYINLLKTLKGNKYRFQPFEQQLNSLSNKAIILRHDVDRAPKNSLRFAKIEYDLGISGSYYFRTVGGSFNEEIIKEISSLGHEIGYHYEDLSIAGVKLKAQRNNETMVKRLEKRFTTRDERQTEEELAEIAIESFKVNLEKFRKIVPVKTICMHGSPMSRWDSRLLWKYYDYHDYGIIGEPYFDIDFNEVLYLTDTGRRWDGDVFNIRDKVIGGRRPATGEDKISRTTHDAGKKEDEEKPAPFTWQPATFPKFHTTFDIIKAAKEGSLPDKIMMTFHPQRWTDKPLPWVKELVWQNVKNGVKFFLVKAGNKRKAGNR